MINTEDQNSLFELVANKIKKDIACFAIGGTAMMFHGYKNATKDIDLVFHSKEDMDEFIDAIGSLGYKERSLFDIYSKEQQKNRNKPRMFTRGEERFDLFLKKVFVLELTEEKRGRFDFIGENTLIIFTPPKEWLIMMKIITNREKDFDDIISICEKEKEIDWDLVIGTILKSADSDWIYLDLEENLKRISKHVFIKKRYFESIYKSFEDRKK